MAEDRVEMEPEGEKLTVFVEKGPRFIDAFTNLQERQNNLKSIDENGKERSFTEKQGLEDLLSFVDLTITTAATSGDKEVEETTILFKDNLVYVGESEFKRATSGIAEHLLQEAREGKSVFLFWANSRSERYTTLRVLEELDRLTEESPNLRGKFKLSRSSREIAKSCTDCSGNCLVAITDDFIVSGSRMTGFASNIFESLLEEGFSPEKASLIIEANVVALKARPENAQLTMGSGESERDLRVFSFYEINEYRNNEGKWAVFPGSSFTGSHSSTDYGFENVLESFSKYLKSKNIKYNKPLLTDIVRPYATDYSDKKYKDPQLQDRWEKIHQKYALASNRV